MKICGECRINKENDQFHRSKAHSGGLAPKCKECVRKYQKLRRKLNYQDIRSKEKESWSKNKEVYNANRRDKRRKNPQEVREAENNCPSRKNGGSGRRSKRWRETHPEYVSEYGKVNPDKMSNAQKKSRYGMTREEVLLLAMEQDNRCWICRKEFENFSSMMTDHDHLCCPSHRKTCGKCIRGLLCNSCNIGLGAFKDNLLFLSNAIKYLEHFKNKERTQ